MSSLWKNNIWILDEEVNCENCSQHWDKRCHAYGKRFENGYCEYYKKKAEPNVIDLQEEYDNYMEEWN